MPSLIHLVLGVATGLIIHTWLSASLSGGGALADWRHALGTDAGNSHDPVALPFATPYANATLVADPAGVERCLRGRTADAGLWCFAAVRPPTGRYFETAAQNLVYLWHTRRGCRQYRSGTPCHLFFHAALHLSAPANALPPIAQRDLVDLAGQLCMRKESVANDGDHHDETPESCRLAAMALKNVGRDDAARAVAQRQCAFYGNGRTIPPTGAAADWLCANA